MRSLTDKLRQLGFYCGIEQELYIQDTGEYTSLMIEGERKGGDTTYTYDFYKQCFHPSYPNEITVYGEDMTSSQLLERVERYLLNRELYLAERRQKI